MIEGLKFDQGKTRFELVPPLALEEVAKVLTFGAKKYGPRNWNLVDDHVDRYLGATFRHINSYMRNNPNDDETGLNHLAHAIVSLMFILDKDLRPQEKVEFDLP